MLNSSGEISEPRQHCLRPGKPRGKSSCWAPQVGLDWTGAPVRRVLARLAACRAEVAVGWASHALARSHWLTAPRGARLSVSGYRLVKYCCWCSLVAILVVIHTSPDLNYTVYHNISTMRILSYQKTSTNKWRTFTICDNFPFHKRFFRVEKVSWDF